MKLKDLKNLIGHTIKELGEDASLYFDNGYSSDRRLYDWGSEGKKYGSLFEITPYETQMYVDGNGNFHLPIREIDSPCFDLDSADLIPETKQQLDNVRRTFEMIGGKFGGILNYFTKEEITVLYNYKGESFVIEIKKDGIKRIE